MLLIHRIKLPLMRKSPHMVKPKKKVFVRRSSSKQLPFEIQALICDMLIGEDASSPFALTAMRVCKAWANFVCERMYRKFQFKNYIQFIGFVNTVSLRDPVLPYGMYVREINLTPVNKYGVDMRVRKLIRHCPNLVNITLGQATSVKADTLQLMGRYCQNVHTLEMGGMISFPFMFDCDFSGMIGLRRLSLLTTPVQSTSLNTIPTSIRHLEIAQLDALQHEEFVNFLKQHPRLISLSVRRCRHINSDFAALIMQLPRLSVLELIGPEVNDGSLFGLFDIPTQLHTLKLCQTQITDATLRAFANGRLIVQNLDITNNAHVSQRGVDALLRKKKFEKLSSSL